MNYITYTKFNSDASLQLASMLMAELIRLRKGKIKIKRKMRKLKRRIVGLNSLIQEGMDLDVSRVIVQMKIKTLRNQIKSLDDRMKLIFKIAYQNNITIIKPTKKECQV